MRLHVYQHVAFEGPALIADWAAARALPLVLHRLFDGEPPALPTPDEALIVLGGPMGVHDEASCPWLVAEKAAIRKALTMGCPVFGICLGAQLLAHVLGARVYRNVEREIGWFPVASAQSGWPLPERFTPLHWHGDTFDLPEGAQSLGSSTLTRHQGFAWRDQALALQFHLEATPDWLDGLIQHGADELAGGGQFVQPPAALQAERRHFEANRELCFALLDRWLALSPAAPGRGHPAHK